ncbi:MAG TPA: FMN-binding negative transcriptional regulator [Rhodocyclaceae bacterium]|nr:FMN-binding negative transcriptional regulator [Rhodocyclaceae bacterium]
MYIPNTFKEDDLSVLQNLMARFPLATVVTVGPEGMEANPVPLFHDPAPREGAPYGVLWGHLARANRQWQDHRPEAGVLAIFHGPESYISPNWYPSKAEHGKAVPTWNYAVVEAKGTLEVIDDPARLRQILTGLTAVHEASQPHPWSLADAPEDFVANQLKAIVGIEIAITRLVGKWKMSQNRQEADRQGVVAGLAGGGESSRAVAGLVAHALNPPPR